MLLGEGRDTYATGRRTRICMHMQTNRSHEPWGYRVHFSQPHFPLTTHISAGNLISERRSPVVFATVNKIKTTEQ